jgi:glutamine amidotransferase
MIKVFIPNYAIGNTRSVIKAFQNLNCEVIFSSSYKDIKKSDIFVLPGDGAFPSAIKQLVNMGFYEAIVKFIKSGKPFLGICVGFQLLFEKGFEYSLTNGFALLKGNVEKFKTKLRIPHIGWNKVFFNKNSFFRDFSENFFYFIHSYRVLWNTGREEFTGSCLYDEKFVAVIEKENIVASQFHPEKSQKEGIFFLEKFLEYARKL